MLEKLVLHNFQCHEKLVIKLDPGITTLVGRSDAGKSAVLRALRWTALNTPSGAAFVRHGASTASATLRLDAGRRIDRNRGDGENAYYLDAAPYVNLRVVPPEIEALLNLSPLNFQDQIDPPFWLTETGGNVSRNLNAIIDLGEIDETLAAATGAVRKKKTEIEITEKRIAAAEARADELAWARDFAADVAELTELDSKLAGIVERRTELAELLDLLRLQRERQQAARPAAVALENLVNSIAEWTHVAANRFCLSEVLKQLRFHRKREAAMNAAVADFAVLVKQRTDAEELSDRRGRLDWLIAEIKKQRRAQCLAKEEMEKIEEEMHQVTNRRCPMCGQPTDVTKLRSSFRTSTSASDPRAPVPKPTRSG